MENMIYKNPEEFGELLAELSEEETEIHVVADFWTIRDIFSEIVMYDEFFMDNIFLVSPDVLENEDEYMLSIFDDGAINISQAIHKGEYIELNEDSLIFIFEDVNSKFAIKNKKSRLIEVDYCDGDCEHCHFTKTDDGYITEYSHGNDGEMHGFTRSKTENGAYYSESFYSSDPELVKIQLNKKNF